MASSFKSPADTAKACVGIAALKEKSSMSNLILLSFLAGAYIAFGGLLAEVATGGLAAAGAPPGIVKLLFGAVFPVGLMLVVIAGSELFTGNNMYMPLGILAGKASWFGLIRNWVGSWVFNLVGALICSLRSCIPYWYSSSRTMGSRCTYNCKNQSTRWCFICSSRKKCYFFNMGTSVL